MIRTFAAYLLVVWYRSSWATPSGWLKAAIGKVITDQQRQAFEAGRDVGKA